LTDPSLIKYQFQELFISIASAEMRIKIFCRWM